jgi:hypothetical protein
MNAVKELYAQNPENVFLLNKRDIDLADAKLGQALDKFTSDGGNAEDFEGYVLAYV